ncbi:fibropellin-1 [Patella vulgata]|uniref:fibropellin-1 n=1 Tax=Patella vulgata TaxID=6465 RepID=UPI00217F6A5F|nr:fibropellin-1 [Patella vulgata]
MITSRIIVVILVLSVWILVVKGIEIQQAIKCKKACVNGGQCVVSQAATPGSICSGFQQTCNCPSSYTGEFCETFILQANCEKVCQNGGQCVANYQEKICSNVSFICDCPKNYFGDLCETFIPDPTCEPPCIASQGECIILPNSESASHPTGIAFCNCSFSSIGYYHGNHCQYYQQNAHLCDPPCLPFYGECVLLRNSLLASHLPDRTYCNCSAISTGYFYGSQCQNYIPNARSCHIPCHNGGTCTISGACICPESSYGYYGPGCVVFEYVCTPPCQNGGTCVFNTCLCPYTETGYFTGSTCETFISPGRPCYSPCTNGGKCESIGVCSCTSNSTHNIIGVSDCFLQECVGGCLNGGTCGLGGKCRCLKEYTGVNCETYTGCPCLNNGRCFEDKCACVFNETSGFSGELCVNHTSYNPCYPTVLNGGICLASYPLCPYDDVGYFHGDQCEKYSVIDCNCTEPEKEVCIMNICECEYNLEEEYIRHRKEDGKCGERIYT